MTTAHYRIYNETKLMAQAGNAIWAIVNKRNSGKNVYVHYVEVYNWTTLGTMITADTQTPVPTVLTVGKVSSLTLGAALSPAPLDPAAAAFPGTVRVATGAGYVETAKISKVGVVKNLTNNTYPTPRIGLGSFGTLWTGQVNTTAGLQDIVVRQGEKIAVYCGSTADQNASMPLYIEATLIVEGSPNRTYFVSTVTSVLAATNALLSIDNGAGSGQVVHLHDLCICELGTFDTPYLQLVPVGSVDANAYGDASRTLPVVKMDTSAADLTASQIEVLTNVPILPKGVPTEYLAQSSAGSPKGFNYLQTKDFIGPLYATFFPEGAHAKTAGTTLAPTNMSQGLGRNRSVVKGDSARFGACRPNSRGSCIVLHEGEGIAMVGGAETATIALPIAMSGWLSMDFAVHIEVADATTVAVVVVDAAQAPIIGARVEVKKVSDGSELMNTTTDANGLASATVGYTGSAIGVIVHVRKNSPGDTRYINESTLQTITNLGLTLTVTMRQDTAA